MRCLRTPREVKLREYWRAKGAHIALDENSGVPFGLHFNQGRCTDNDLREAARISTLQTLSARILVSPTSGVRYFVKHPNIAVLRLYSTNITEDSIATFKEMKKLVILDVTDTEIPIESLKELRDALPTTIIYPNIYRRIPKS